MDKPPPLVLITRPALLANPKPWQDAGFKTLIVPFVRIEFLKESIHDKESIIVTSCLGIEGVCRITHKRHFPLVCISKASADYAYQKGFRDISYPPLKANVRDLLKLPFHNDSYLYARGNIISFDLERHLKNTKVNIISKIVYNIIHEVSDKNIVSNLQSSLAVTCYSVESAKRIEKILPWFQDSIALCLSERIAKSLSRPWKRVLVGTTTQDLVQQLKERS